MREKVKDRGRLEHILEAINEIQEYKSQYTLEDVKNSKLVFYGFTKFVEVICVHPWNLWDFDVKNQKFLGYIIYFPYICTMF